MISSSLRTLDGLGRVRQLGPDLLDRRAAAAIEDLHDLAFTAGEIEVVGFGMSGHRMQGE